MVQAISREVKDLTPAALNRAIIPIDTDALTDLDSSKLFIPLITKDGVGIDKDTLIACNFEGVDAATIDNSDDPSAHKLTFIDLSKISTAQFKTGSSSAFIDGVDANSPRIDFTINSIPLFSSDEITVEGWLRPDDIADDGVGLAWLEFASGSGNLDIVADMSSGGFIIFTEKGSGGGENKWTIPHSWAVNTQVHYRMSMSGNTVTFAIDGLNATVTDVVTSNPAVIVAGLDLTNITLGHTSNTPTTNNYQGYMDGFRVSDIARDAVTTFTPQTSIFERETLTKILVPLNLKISESGDILTIDKLGLAPRVDNTFSKATSDPISQLIAPAGKAMDSRVIGFGNDITPVSPGATPVIKVRNNDTTDGNYSIIEGLNSNGNRSSYDAFINDNHGSNDGSRRSYNNEGGTFNEYHNATKEGYNLYPNQPAFFARLASAQSNVTGNAEVFTIPYDSEIFDVGGDFNTGTGKFTAPITGKYAFSCFITLQGLTGHTDYLVELITSSRTLRLQNINPTGMDIGGTLRQSFGKDLTDMVSGDTAEIKITLSGGATVVDIPAGSDAQPNNSFSGYLVL